MDLTNSKGDRERKWWPPTCGNAAAKRRETPPATVPDGGSEPRKRSRLTRCAEVSTLVAAGCGLILATAKLVEVFLS